MQCQSLSKSGLGFRDGQSNECHMESAVDALNGKDEDLIKAEANGHPAKDIKLKDALFELEDCGQATIDELVEIT